MKPRPQTLERSAGARRARVSTATDLISVGVGRYEERLQPALGLEPAATKADGRRLVAVERRVTVEVLRAAVLAFGVEEQAVRTLRLFDDAFCGIQAAHEFEPLPATHPEPEQLGELLESMLALGALRLKGQLTQPSRRKVTGSFYTPRRVVDSVVAAALAPWMHAGKAPPRVCDPAMGGGAFLLGVARALARHTTMARSAIVGTLHGFDIEPLAVATTEAALWLWSGEGAGRDASHDVLGAADERTGSRPSTLRQQLRVADALTLGDPGVFELVIGNPPWVAYAGRATQPLTDQRRTWLSKHYEAFRGYPTLHACFVELAARLAPQGRLALLVPSPLADLDGYRPMRRVLTRTHRLHDELTEYGQDAFDGVVQPCFGLIADSDPSARESEERFELIERSGVTATASRVEPPDCLARLNGFPRFAAECFREFGFQTTREVTETMLCRADAPVAPHLYPLVVGRNVHEFRVGLPQLYLDPDLTKLQRLHVKLRPLEEYRTVELVVRQTARYPIAALHNGLPFRNSLLAGFGCAEYSAPVLVGLLNSTLLRALHLAGQRDARQKTFPQVKVAHLRGLPAPPPDPAIAAELEQLVKALTMASNSTVDDRSSEPADATEDEPRGGSPRGQGGALDRDLRSGPARVALDTLVYGWYGFSSEEAKTVGRFFIGRTS